MQVGKSAARARIAALCVGLAFLFSAALGLPIFSQKVSPGSPASPPVAPVRAVTDDYYGTRVVDPYRYIEKIQEPDVQSWTKAQNDYTTSTIAAVPGRAALLARIKTLDQSVPKVSSWRLPGDAYLLLKRLPGEDVAKLYLRQSVAGTDKLLLDPQSVKLAANKGKNAIMYFNTSLDEKYLAVGIAPGGSERDTELHILEIATRRETGDVISHAWDGITSWLPGNRAFVYGRLQKLAPGAPVTETEQKFRYYLHVLGTSPESDPAAFGYDVVPSIQVNPTYFASIVSAPSFAYAIGSLNGGVSPNSAFYIEPVGDLAERKPSWRKVADESDDVSDIEEHADDLYVPSYKDALRYKVLRTDARNPNIASAEEVVPPSQAVVTQINPAEDALYVLLLDGGLSRVQRVPYGPHPKAEELSLPVKGAATLTTDPRVAGALIELMSSTTATKIYTYNPITKQLTDTKLQPPGPLDTPDSIQTTEVKVRSYDGTEVPLSITRPRNMKFDGSSPTLMEAYGAYGVPFLPSYDPVWLAWYEKGGIHAVCHVRGGGEYGEEWHLAGKEATKPNTWRDFIACAQYLIDQKYTSPAHLAGAGTSAGGIMIGRSFTERPDLFAAAIDRVGCSDTLRMETTANGVPNIPEFGSTKTEAGFKALYEMSAYDHIKPHTAYPAVMFETGMNDPRVDPWQMAKMAARLQASTSSGKAVLLRVEYAGGHGGIGGTEAQKQERDADEWSFLLWQFGAPGF